MILDILIINKFQRNYLNREYFYFIIASFSNWTLFSFTSLFLCSSHQSSLALAFPSISLSFFLTYSFLIFLSISIRPSALVNFLFSQDNARPFNRVAPRSCEIHPFLLHDSFCFAVSVSPAFLLAASFYRIHRFLSLFLCFLPHLSLSNCLASYTP